MLNCDVFMCTRPATVQLTVLRGISEKDTGKQLNLCTWHLLSNAKKLYDFIKRGGDHA